MLVDASLHAFYFRLVFTNTCYLSVAGFKNIIDIYKIIKIKYMENTDRMIIAGKCRCCNNIDIWDFGEASDKQHQLLNMYVSEACKNYCKNSYCENCEGIVLFDVLFFGIKSKLQKAIENLKKQYS